MQSNVYDNTSFPVMWLFPHWLFSSVTQFLQEKNLKKEKKNERAWAESQDPAA